MTDLVHLAAIMAEFEEVTSNVRKVLMAKGNPHRKGLYKASYEFMLDLTTEEIRQFSDDLKEVIAGIELDAEVEENPAVILNNALNRVYAKLTVLKMTVDMRGRGPRDFMDLGDDHC